jgi:hypothetical protein
MDRHDPSIYPGQYVTCVYNPDRALCQRRDGAEGPCLPTASRWHAATPR